MMGVVSSVTCMVLIGETSAPSLGRWVEDFVFQYISMHVSMFSPYVHL